MQPPSSSYPPGPMKRYRVPPKQPPEARLPASSHFRWMWILFGLAIAALLFAWYVPIRVVFLRAFSPGPPVAPREAYRFVALAYDRIGPDGVSLDQVDAQLGALEQAGFVPLSLRDVRGLLRTGEPVPRNGVLITWNHPRAATFDAVTRLLRQRGWNAVAFLDGDGASPVPGKNPSSVQLRLGLGERRWEIGTTGHDAWTRIRPEPGADPLPFNASRMWLEDQDRLETIYEFHLRVERDQIRSLERMAQHVGVPAAAYAYPYGAFGQQDGEAGVLRSLILFATISRNSDLAFIEGPWATNTRYSDPMRLNRLRVHPDWSARELIRQIDLLQDRLANMSVIDPPLGGSAWVMAHGDANVNEQAIQLAVAPDSGPSEWWIAGSAHGSSSAVLDVDFTLTAGAVRVLLRSDWSRPDRWFLELFEDGTAHFVQRNLRGEEVVWATGTGPLQLGERQQLRVECRDQVLAASLNGVSLFDAPVRIDALPDTGLSGIGLYPVPGFATASMDVFDVQLSRLDPRIALWEADDERALATLSTVRKSAQQYAVISPPLEALAIDGNDWGHAYRQLAAQYQAGFYPSVTLNADLDLFLEWPPVAWSDSVKATDCEGFFIRFAGATGTTTVGDITRWLEAVGERLRAAGKQLIVRLPTSMERAVTLQAIMGYLPDIRFAVSSNADIREGWPAGSPVPVREERVADNLLELPLYIRLRGEEELQNENQQEMEIARLRKAGDEAYREGDFEQAIVHYSDWLQLEPENPMPPKQIGDTLSRMNYRDEAIDFYLQSLEKGPMQIDLMVQVVDLLDAARREQEARLLLNRYAVLYPAEDPVLLAQAEWLFRRNRILEGLQRVNRVLERDDANVAAALLLLRYAQEADERRTAIRVLVDEGLRPGNRATLLAGIQRFDLLSLPGTAALRDALDRIADATRDPQLLEQIEALQPLYHPVHYDLADAGFPDSWVLEGGTWSRHPAGLEIGPLSGRTDCWLGLGGSHTWIDSYIETTIDVLQGGFWLVARQSGSHMVRLGMAESDAVVHLQVWRRHRNEWQLTEQRQVPRDRPAAPVTVRLAVRGRGAIAYWNGARLFDAPLPLPEWVGMGRVGIETRASEPGRARIRLAELRAGPLPARIAVVQDGPLEEVNTQVERLRPALSSLTDLAPAWFTVTEEGWRSPLPADEGLYRALATLHGLRLRPLVQVEDWQAVSAGDVRSILRLHDLDGVLLTSSNPPDAAWWTAWRNRTELADSNVAIMTDPAEGDVGQLWAGGAASAWLKGREPPVEIDVIAWDQRQDDKGLPVRHRAIYFYDKQVQRDLRDPEERDETHEGD